MRRAHQSKEAHEDAPPQVQVRVRRLAVLHLEVLFENNWMTQDFFWGHNRQQPLQTVGFNANSSQVN